MTRQHLQNQLQHAATFGVILSLMAAAGCSQAAIPKSVASKPSSSDSSSKKLPTQATNALPPSAPEPTNRVVLPRYTIPPLRELKLHGGQPCDPAFSPDGRFIATGAKVLDERIAIWNWPDGSLEKTIVVTGAGGIRSLSFSEDSNLLAYSTLGRTYAVLRVSDGKELARHDDPHYRYGELRWSRDGDFVYALARYGGDNEVHRLSLESGKSEVVIPKFREAEFSFCDFPSMPLMISEWTDQGEPVGLFALAGAIDRTKPDKSFHVPSTQYVESMIAISHDGTHIAFRKGWAREIDVFEIESWKRVGGFEVIDDQLGMVKFIPGSNKKLLSTSIRHTWNYNAIAVHDIAQPGERSRKLEVHAPTTVSGLTISRDGKLLALGFNDGEAAVWSLSDIENGAGE